MHAVILSYSSCSFISMLPCFQTLCELYTVSVFCVICMYDCAHMTSAVITVHHVP